MTIGGRQDITYVSKECAYTTEISKNWVKGVVS